MNDTETRRAPKPPTLEEAARNYRNACKEAVEARAKYYAANEHRDAMERQARDAEFKTEHAPRELAALARDAQ